MSVIEITEITFGRGGDFGPKNLRTYRRTLQAITDDPRDSVATVALALATHPTLGIDIWHPYACGNDLDIGSKCQKISIQNLPNTHTAWAITADYTTDFDAAQAEENPLRRNPVIRITSEKFQSPALSTIDGKVRQARWQTLPDGKRQLNVFATKTAFAIVNSAGFPYDPPPEIDDSRFIVTIERNEGTNNIALFYDMKDAVNDRPFWGQPARTWKLDPPELQEVYEGQYHYWKVVYTLHFNADTWDIATPDRGRHGWFTYGDYATTYRFLDKTGQYVDDPILMDGNGAPLAVGAEPVINVYRANKIRDFRRLRLPGG